jgi:hypothetical protein
LIVSLIKAGVIMAKERRRLIHFNEAASLLLVNYLA